MVANFGAGYDGLDINALAKQGIQVSNTPEVLSDCVADLTIMLMIASARDLKPGGYTTFEIILCGNIDDIVLYG